jgi:hypothetical protein
VAYEFKFERKPGYLHVRVRGDNTPENVRQSLQDTLAACAAHGCPRVLIEENLAGPSLGTMDIFSIVTQGSEKVSTTVTSIAYVDTNPAHDRQLMRFAESVALNRGVRVKLCSTVAEAATHLEAEAAATATRGGG